MNETLILDDLSIGYATKTVAHHLNHALHSGELTCLLGANGIGKSTLLRTLSGFQPPIAGRVLVKTAEDSSDNTVSAALTDISGLGKHALARTVSIVLTEKPDIRQMTVEALVSLGRQPYTGFWGRLTPDDKAIVRDAMTMVGIEPLSNRNVATLSDGERQKVMIAKSIAQQTPIILLDEPTAFLDYPSKVDMLLLLRDISRRAGKTVFLSTHDVDLALQLADRLWLMQKEESPAGQQPSPIKQQSLSAITIISGTPAALAADGSLSAFFNHPGVEYDSQTSILRVKTASKD